MKIKVIYNKKYPKTRWIIWERNIGVKFFGGLVGLWPLEMNTNLRNSTAIRVLSFDRRAAYGDDDDNWEGKSRILSTDEYRNLTLKEYYLVSSMLKLANTRYNKKKDKFTKVK